MFFIWKVWFEIMVWGFLFFGELFGKVNRWMKYGISF